MGGQDTGRSGAREWGQMPPQSSAGGGMGGVLMALLPVVLSMLSSRGGGGGQSGQGGGLGDILGQVLGGGAAQRGGGGGGMADILGGMLGGGAQQGGMGGLGGLLEQLQRSGYGDQARSWVETGPNKSIPPDAMEQVFGRGGLSEIARRAGLSEADTSRGLSALLPEVVDRVTPQGRVPDHDSLSSSVDDLVRRLGLA
jgi:uncharacterized protein YidB (DUF937 family)